MSSGLSREAADILHQNYKAEIAKLKDDLSAKDSASTAVISKLQHQGLRYEERLTVMHEAHEDRTEDLGEQITRLKEKLTSANRSITILKAKIPDVAEPTIYDFDSMFKRCSEVGWCDTIGGAEYARVKDEWLASGKRTPIESFINWRANAASISSALLKDSFPSHVKTPEQLVRQEISMAWEVELDKVKEQLRIADQTIAILKKPDPAKPYAKCHDQHIATQAKMAEEIDFLKKSNSDATRELRARAFEIKKYIAKVNEMHDYGVKMRGVCEGLKQQLLHANKAMELQVNEIHTLKAKVADQQVGAEYAGPMAKEFRVIDESCRLIRANIAEYNKQYGQIGAEIKSFHATIASADEPGYSATSPSYTPASPMIEPTQELLDKVDAEREKAAQEDKEIAAILDSAYKKRKDDSPSESSVAKRSKRERKPSAKFVESIQDADQGEFEPDPQ